MVAEEVEVEVEEEVEVEVEVEVEFQSIQLPDTQLSPLGMGSQTPEL
jgi:hypothetical protein